MRIALDATPAAVQQAGVGRYVRELLTALVSQHRDDEYVLASAGNDAENAALLRNLPPGQFRDLRRLPLNPRWMTAAWYRLRLPLTVESLIGEFDVFHGPDFVVPASRMPRVVTIHDLSFRVVPQFAEPSLVEYLGIAVPRAVDAATIVITVSAAVAAEVAAAYPGAIRKLVAIPNGVRMPSRKRERVAGCRPEVLVVGTIEPRKNLSMLLDAMRIVRDAFPDARLTIAGRIGWRADDIVRQIRHAESSDHLRFIEAPDDDRLDTLYAEATLAVVPSRYEGFGLPVLEAMARGVPVVANDIASLRETGGAAALYGDASDADNFASAILAFLTDAALCERYIIAGSIRAHQLSWTETARQTRKAYELAAGG